MGAEASTEPGPASPQGEELKIDSWCCRRTNESQEKQPHGASLFPSPRILRSSNISLDSVSQIFSPRGGGTPRGDCSAEEVDGMKEGLSWLSKANHELQLKLDVLRQANTELRERNETLSARNRRLQDVIKDDRTTKEWDRIGAVEQHYRDIMQPSVVAPMTPQFLSITAQKGTITSSGASSHEGSHDSSSTSNSAFSLADSIEAPSTAAPETVFTSRTASTHRTVPDVQWIPISSRVGGLQVERPRPLSQPRTGMSSSGTTRCH
jgi:hypothetical protein